MTSSHSTCTGASFVNLEVRRKSSNFVQVTTNLSLLLKVAAGQRAGSKHITSLSGTYVVLQCCHYQRCIAAVLGNVVFVANDFGSKYPGLLIIIIFAAIRNSRHIAHM